MTHILDPSKLPVLGPCVCGGARSWCYGPGARVMLIGCIACGKVIEPLAAESPAAAFEEVTPRWA